MRATRSAPTASGSGLSARGLARARHGGRADTRRARMRKGVQLIRCDGLLLAALLAHVAVHLIQQSTAGATVPLQLWIAAGMLIAFVSWALALAIRRDVRAPMLSALAGFGTAAATLLGHAAPPWGALSASYWSAGAHANALSWLLLGLVCAIGLWTGTTAWKMIRATNPRRR